MQLTAVSKYSVTTFKKIAKVQGSRQRISIKDYILSEKMHWLNKIIFNNSFSLIIDITC